MAIHENLRNLRRNRGMTQQQAADQLHLTRQAISSYEAGRTRPDVETLLRLAELYGTDLDAILSGSSRTDKARKHLKVTGAIVFILLTALSAISSALLWTANRFYAMPIGGLTAEGKEIFALRQQLLSTWKTLDAVLLTAALAGGLLLLILSVRGIASIKAKILYTASLAIALLCIALLFGYTDPVYAIVDYLITPLHVLGRLVLFLLVSLAADALRRKKNITQI